jgi:DNA-binding SARP family transcriptional activator/Tfp pilus assembly protein PilF
MSRPVLVRLLGPVDVLVDGTIWHVRGLRRKAVLAALALHAGEIVSTKRLIEFVWDNEAPRTAATTLRSHLSDLRRLLDNRIPLLARPPGYLLDIGDGATDVQTARRLIGQAAQSLKASEREALLRKAIALWRDRPLADLSELGSFEPSAHQLRELLLQAHQLLIDTRLDMGQHNELIPELESLSQSYPLHEPIHAKLMLALYRTGRQGDALEIYHRLRRALDHDLGLGPSRQLSDLETAILRQDPGLDLPAATVTTAATQAVTSQPIPVASTTPAQLPPAIATFTGRSKELTHLDSFLAGTGGAHGGAAPPGAAIIAAISGTAGVGKTTLAVAWAHRTAAHFPDGQLFINLRGFDPSGTPMTSADAISTFLETLGVPAERIPSSLDAQIGLYRSLLAGKRVLLLLDNARSADQVRPLLPSAPGCLTIVTSRNQLTSSAATDGAHLLALDLLSTAEAHELLARRVGADRTAAEPDAVAEIITHCAQLPLALAITAAHAAANPHLPLTALAAQLRNTPVKLDTLDGGDAATDIRVVFTWSYDTLDSAAARLFRMLGLHPGSDISAAAAASLAGQPVQQVHPQLTELVQANLLTEHRPGRYAFHDLLRSFAAGQAHINDSDDDRHAALRRVLDHYLHTANNAARLLYPPSPVYSIDLAPSPSNITLGDFDSEDAATKWCIAERAAILAAIDYAADNGFDAHTWQLAWCFRPFLHRQGLWCAEHETQHRALTAARRLNHKIAEAKALHALAVAHMRLGRFDSGEHYFLQALSLNESLNDPAAEALTHMGMSDLAGRRGRPTDALEHAKRALDLCRTAGDDLAGDALNHIGWHYAQLGDYHQALIHCQKALALQEGLGYVAGQADTWDSLGYAHHGLAQYDQAVLCYQHAVELYRSLGDRYNEADTLTSLGMTFNAAGNDDAADKAWKEALKILDQLDSSRSDRLRNILRSDRPGNLTPGLSGSPKPAESWRIWPVGMPTAPGQNGWPNCTPRRPDPRRFRDAEAEPAAGG